MISTLPLLSILIWLPVLGAIVVCFFGKPNQENIARWIALLVSLFSVAMVAYMWPHFDINTPAMQFVEDHPWINVYGIRYSLGVDGISFPLVALTCFTTILVILTSWTMVKFKVAQYLSIFLLMQAAIIGTFSATDSMLFYFFWEAMLIPMYLSIGIWGGGNRSYAAIKFFIFTFLGSALMLIAILYLHTLTNSFAISSFYNIPHIALNVQTWLFVGFLLAFGIKVPMWPLHTWLPDAHTEAPSGGSVILAALMLKLGAYGLLRFNMPILPDASVHLAWLMIVLSLIAIVYVGIVALAQTDMKRLIAYSSVAHMGFVTLGFFMFYMIVARTGNIRDALMAIEGGMMQMVTHAFGSGAMFLAFGVLYHQIHTREIKAFGGIANTMPIFAAFFMLFAMSNAGLPGTSGFVGEFMVILSMFKTSFWVALLSALTLIVGASYTLWMYKRVFYGEVVHEKVKALKDVSGIDTLVFILLGVTVIVVGVYPDPVIHLFHASVGHTMHLALSSKL